MHMEILVQLSLVQLLSLILLLQHSLFLVVQVWLLKLLFEYSLIQVPHGMISSMVQVL